MATETIALPLPITAPAPRAALATLYRAGHPWAKQVLAYAAAKTPPYGDYGQWHALAYAMTGKAEYAITAADRIWTAADASLRPTAKDSNGNNVRQQFADHVLLAAMIAPALDPDRLAKLRDVFDRTAAFCFAIGTTGYEGGWRAGDQDQELCQACAVWLLDQLFGTKWRDATQTRAPVTTWADIIAVIKILFAQAKGGEPNESWRYNVNTFMLVFTARIMIGDEFKAVFPEIDTLADECATFALASLTPDYADWSKWGDTDGAYEGYEITRVLPYLYVLYHVTGRRDLWAAIQQIEAPGGKPRPLADWFFLGWRVMYGYRPAPEPLSPEPPPVPPVPPTVEERLDLLESKVNALINGTPVPVPKAAAPVAVKPTYLYVASGTGHVRYKRGNAYFACHAPNADWHGDHWVTYAFDLQAWFGGKWWLRSLRGYGLRAISGLAANAPLFAGLSSMWSIRMASVTETDTGVVVVGQTSGNKYAPTAWNAPKPFVNLFERRCEYDYSGRIVVRDTFDGVDPRGATLNYGGYSSADRALLDAALSAGRLWQQNWQVPVAPTETASGYTWTVPGLAQPVVMTVPANVKREVIPTASVLNPKEFGPGQTDGYQVRLSSAAEKVTMETTLYLGG